MTPDPTRLRRLTRFQAVKPLPTADNVFPVMTDYVTVSEGINVRERAEELGCNVPDRFSIVPTRLEGAESPDDLLHEAEAITLRKVIEQEGEEIEETPIDEGLELNTYHKQGADFFGPVIYFSSTFLLNHWDEVVTITSIIQIHLQRRSVDEAHLAFNCEKENGDDVMIEYDGPADEVESVLDTIEEVTDND